MSYFIFGSFDLNQNKSSLQDVKIFGKRKDVYFWFDEEITFYNDIARMCLEQNSCGNMQFALTSFNQKYNSSDLLFPYDKYTNEELFKDKSREFFCQCCHNNLNIVFDCLKKFMEVSNPSHLEIFVTEGYDDAFQRKRCTLSEMKEDLLSQIEAASFIDSCIYQIHSCGVEQSRICHRIQL